VNQGNCMPVTSVSGLYTSIDTKIHQTSYAGYDCSNAYLGEKGTWVKTNCVLSNPIALAQNAPSVSG